MRRNARHVCLDTIDFFYHLRCLNVDVDDWLHDIREVGRGNLGATSVDEEILCKVREDVCYVRYVSDDLSCEIVV